MVSYAYWQRYLGGAADLSAFHLGAEGAVYSVVGVMPKGFNFPAGAALWVTRTADPDHNRTAHNWRVVARLRPGVTIARARADLGAIARRIHQQFGKDADLSDAAVMPLADSLVGDVRTALLTLLAAVALLLLVACANVAGLLLARTSARRKELAIRAALGAGRWRLVQQFLAESFLLSFAGGAFGIAIAAAAVRGLPAIIPANLPRQEGVAMNAPVLLFALASVVVIAVALGLFGAWRATAGDPQPALNSGARGSGGAGASQRFRGFLVAGEIAATLVILVGAGLLGRSFLRLVTTDPGFSPQNLITMQFSVTTTKWQVDARQIRMLGDLMARLKRIPGAQSVGLASALPVAAGDDLPDGTFLLLNGRKPPANFDEYHRLRQNAALTAEASYCVAGDEYFRTMGIPLIRGRRFREQDVADAPNVAVVSQSLARRQWPHQDPIGQTIFFGNMDGIMKPLTIVGIVGDVRARGLDFPAASVIYVDYRQRGMSPSASPTVLVRAAAPAGEIVSAARAIFHDAAPDVPVKFSTFENEMGGWLADRRFLLLLVGFFAAAALTVAAIGIYGVVAFSVTRRAPEIGIRVALGAGRADVLRLIVGEGARLAIAGLTIGIAASLLLTRLVASLLFGVSATDPLTFLAVSALLSLFAVLASYLPARRAMRLDPNRALRYE